MENKNLNFKEPVVCMLGCVDLHMQKLLLKDITLKCFCFKKAISDILLDALGGIALCTIGRQLRME